MMPYREAGYGLQESFRAGKRAFLLEEVKRASSFDDLRNVLLDLFEDKDNLL
jgi:hypothetical protein